MHDPWVHQPQNSQPSPYRGSVRSHSPVRHMANVLGKYEVPLPRQVLFDGVELCFGDVYMVIYCDM